VEKNDLVLHPVPSPLLPTDGLMGRHLTCFCLSALARDFKIIDGNKSKFHLSKLISGLIVKYF
jgi:hypothetical protein